MSLNWEIGGIKNHEELWVECGTDAKGEKEYQLCKATESLIWATLGIGLGKITKKNVEQWYQRLYFLSKIDNGAWDDLVNIEVLERHIGLVTNATYTSDTDLQFIKRIGKNVLRDASRSLESQREKNAKPKLEIVK